MSEENEKTTNPEAIKDKNEVLTYDIDKVRNEVSIIEKEEGSQAIISYLQELFDKNHLRFNHLISFFKVLVRNMKKAKAYTLDEIFHYVNDQIEKYPEKNNVEFYCNIADILERINKNYSISFLEGKINPAESDGFKDISYLSPMIKLSSYYKDIDKASELKERVFSLFSRKVNDLDFKNLTLSLSTLIYFIRGKSEYSDQKKIEFINDNLKKFIENNDFKTIKKIADLYEIVGIPYSIEYLELMNSKTDDDYSLLLRLSDYYLKIKESDKAFKTIQKASYLTINISDSFDYLWKQGEVCEKFANICYEGQAKPIYADYLHYTVVSFIIGVARDLLMFPTIRRFYEMRQMCFEKNWGLDYNSVDEALNDLNMFAYKKELTKCIYDWVFYKVPILMGVPVRFIALRSLEDTATANENFKWALTNHPTLNYKSIKDIPALAHKFVSETVKEWYDKTNSGK